MRIASWNVNSIRARLEHVKRWLAATQPDVLLLQELKGTEFPAEDFRPLGYESAAVTQKTYNGVAILSRLPLETLATALPGDETDTHARYLEVRTGSLRVVDVYMPNGNPVDGPKFAYKLAWMKRIQQRMAEWIAAGEAVVIGGDFNVIPEEIDCHKPEAWLKDALFQPEVRALYREFLAAGYTDAFRTLHPGETGQYTFWDYFRDNYQKNRGIRIDHFLLSPAAAPRLKDCTIDGAPRAEEKPSDHTPIVLELA
ncbi:MAG: exodeoxyribonuclease III [Acidobacteriota bacterium]|nr:exodeoxyribonuclease III [Acidobacteriota bacterium]